MTTQALGVTIRRAAESDLSEVVLLERETPTAPHWGAAEYKALAREGCGAADGIAAGFAAGAGSELRRCLFVAAEAGSLAGFAVGRAVGLAPRVEAEIESVVVRGDERRQGLGTALCRAVMEWSRAQGAESVELEVRARSGGAILLYGGLGFVETGRRPGYYSHPPDDALVMRCVLHGRRRVPEPETGTGWLPG